MMKRILNICLMVVTILGLANLSSVQGSLVLAQSDENTLLHPGDLEAIIPKTVFFRGQSAPVQIRNSAGIKFKDGMFLFASLVDTSGYSTSVQQKYQAYFVTEVPVTIGSTLLPPGAYGIGFIGDNQFIVMDVGAHSLFTVSDERDEKLKRPTPLQILPGDSSGDYRLYEGRAFVTLRRAKN